jgi:hypothetical protein
MRHTTVALLAGIAVLSVSCGAPSEPLPFLASTPGIPPTVYSGTIVDSSSGSGTINLSLVSVDGRVSGTWNATFGGKPGMTEYISGTQNGTAYSATVTPCPDTDQNFSCTSCRWLFSGSLTPSSLTGTYSTAPTPACQDDSGKVSANH